MKVLVPGGFGFVGGRLAQHLAHHGANQILLGTRRLRPAPDWLPEARVVQMHWASSEALEGICSDVDAIVHLAGMNAADCEADPAAALEFKAGGTERLVRAAARQEVGRFIYVSSAHVYGSPLTGTITEHTPAKGLHPYATSHRAAEEVVRLAVQSDEIEGAVIRLSNAYGAPAHVDAGCWMLLINDLCRQAVESRCMVLRSNGLQWRDFVPMREACRAISHLIESPAGASGAVVNVGGGHAMTVWEAACLIVERCEAVLGFRPALERVQPHPAETAPALDFRIDALRESGFVSEAGHAVEVDRLLRFCAESCR